ncbi:MAG: T9SS type A sorting domain-containing protein [Flavobacteriales bacterium]|nr:T9SS type A sorting domain-containing protein [Flavobacteriales bacterium]
MLLVHLSAQSTLEWQHCLGGSQNEQANCVEQTQDGGYILAGWSLSTDGDITGHHGTAATDYWVVKTSDTGSLLWEKSLGGNWEDQATAVRQTADNGFIVAGFTASANNGDVTGFHGGYDYWVVKLSSTGNLEWQKCLGGTSTYGDKAYDIKQTTDGGYVVAGSTMSTDGDVTGHHGTLNNDDYWVVKLSPAGDLEWQKALGGSDDDVARSVDQTADGGFIVAGNSESLDGDVTGHHSTASNTDYWVVKLSSFGTIEWERSLGGTGNDNANCVQQTTDGGYIVAGESFSMNDGDVTGHHGSLGNYDFWVTKLSASGALEWQKCLGGNGGDLARSVDQTDDGGYVLTGQSNSSNGDVTGSTPGNFLDLWAVKISSTGALQSQKTWGGTDSESGSSVQQTADGGYIMAGGTSSNDVAVSGNNGTWDYWLIKLSADATSVMETGAHEFDITLTLSSEADQLLVRTEGPSANAQLMLFDALGSTVFSTNMVGSQHTVSIGSFNPGVYLVSLSGVNGVYHSRRFVKPW